MKYPTAIINPHALRHNIGIVRQKAPQARIIAIVKANAYGHGLTDVARALYKYVDGFGVARVSEAEILRNEGIKSKILLLEGFVDPLELLTLCQLKLDTVVHCFRQLEIMEEFQNILPGIVVWIKYNTGMNRIGFDQDEVVEVKERLSKLAGVKQIQLMTHLASADDFAHPELTSNQINKFDQIGSELTAEQSIGASSGILFHPDSHRDWIRPGIITYGISPTHESIREYGFIPAMNLETVLISVHKRKKGDLIGYSGTYQLPEDTTIGVVAIGYGDGYTRNAKIGTPVWINGRIVKLVGRVSMDMITVDLGYDAKDQVGDRVVLFGRELPVEVVSKAIGNIPYEMTTSLTERVSWVIQDLAEKSVDEDLAVNHKPL